MLGVLAVAGWFMAVPGPAAAKMKPRATVPGVSGSAATLPLTAVMNLAAPPGGAAGLGLRVTCGTDAGKANLVEVRLNAVPVEMITQP